MTVLDISHSEALANIQDAIKLHVEDRKAEGEWCN
jgi:predicted RNase H-like HicB family nuclease